VAVGQSQRFYSGVGIFNWYYLSSPPQIPRRRGVDLELGGLTYIRTYIHSTVQYGPRVNFASTSTARWTLGTSITMAYGEWRVQYCTVLTHCSIDEGGTRTSSSRQLRQLLLVLLITTVQGTGYRYSTRVLCVLPAPV
jgi:hypothetical protein